MNGDVCKVSVLMSVYNGARFLRESVDSILEQSFCDFELVIINDASTDETRSIISSYKDSRIRLIDNECNFGLTRSLNRGIELLKGQYMARQDADDVSLPGRLARQVEFLDRNPAVGLVGTAYAMIDEHGRRLHEVFSPTDSKDIKEQLFLIRNPFAHGAVMCRRSCFDVTGPYRADLPCSQDYELWLRFAEKFELANLAEVLYLWRMTLNSISVKKKVVQERCADLAIQWYYERQKLGEERIPVDSEAFTAGMESKEAVIRGYQVWGGYFLLHGNYREARQMLGKAWLLVPWNPITWLLLVLTVLGPLVPGACLKRVSDMRQRRIANQFKIS